MLGLSHVRRRRGWVAALAVTALVVTGCTEDPEKSASPTGPTLLSVAVYGPEPVITAYTTIANNYSAANPNTSVSIERYSDAAAAEAALTQQQAAGNAPDLFLSSVQSVPRLIEEKSIREVGSLLLDRRLDFGDDYQRYSLEAFSSDQSLQCMPVDSSPMVVYYNTDLIDLSQVNSELEAEVTQETGWTFEQFEVAARQKQGGGVRGIYVEPSLDQLAPFIYSGGGQLLDNSDDPTRLNLSDGSTRDALQKVLPLFRDPVVTFSQAEIAQTSALQRFRTGSLAMMLGFRSLTPTLRAAKDLNFDVMPMPRVGSETTIGETSGICLSAASTQVDAAADFLAYAVSDESAALLADTGYVVPSNNAVVNDDAFRQPAQEPAHPEIFADQVRSIRALPTSPAWPEVVRATIPSLSKLFYDPLFESLEDRLREIDEVSVPYFMSASDASPSPTG